MNHVVLTVFLCFLGVVFSSLIKLAAVAEPLRLQCPSYWVWKVASCCLWHQPEWNDYLISQNSVPLCVFLSLKSSAFVGDHPSLDLLWFGTGPEVSALRLTSFLSIFDCQEFSELYGAVEDSLLAALCLVTYIVVQVVMTFCSLFDGFQWKQRWLGNFSSMQTGFFFFFYKSQMNENS